MKEFDYELDYKSLDFRCEVTRKLYRIGRGEQGVLLVRPYTDLICAHWRFKTPEEAEESSERIYSMFKHYKNNNDFVGMDIARKFLEMGFTRARRYANHNDGKKYDSEGNVKPQEPDWNTSKYAVAARIFKKVRDIVAYNPVYQSMRKDWRKSE